MASACREHITGYVQRPWPGGAPTTCAPLPARATPALMGIPCPWGETWSTVGSAFAHGCAPCPAPTQAPARAPPPASRGPAFQAPSPPADYLVLVHCAKRLNTGLVYACALCACASACVRITLSVLRVRVDITCCKAIENRSRQKHHTHIQLHTVASSMYVGPWLSPPAGIEMKTKSCKKRACIRHQRGVQQGKLES
jgi:hypothetical protein